MSENNSERKDVYIKIKKPLILNFNIKLPKIKIIHYIVYKITDMTNGYFYIGAHKQKFVDPYEFDGYWSSSEWVLKSIEKHGEENFKRETIEICKTWWDALDRETFWIEELKSNRNKYPKGLGMNLNSGGWGNKNGSKEYGFTGQNHSDETRKKMSETHKKGPKGKDHPNYGKHPSEATRKKMKESHWDNSGEKHPNFGKRPSDETIRKMVENTEYKHGEDHPLYGTTKPEEVKEQHRKTVSGEGNSFYGKEHTDESKQKMSESLKGKKCKNYRYILSNNEDYLEFFDAHDKEIIWKRFRFSKNNKIEYKGIIIERIELNDNEKRPRKKMVASTREIYSKYIYTLSTNENYWDIFDEKEHQKILKKFNDNKSDTITYKDMIITRELKDNVSKPINHRKNIKIIPGEGYCKYDYTLSNGEDYWKFFDEKDRKSIGGFFYRRKSDIIIYKGITITRVLKDKGENQNG